MSVSISEGQHYNEVRFFGSKYVTKRLDCNYCEYSTKRKDYMLKHLAKKHQIKEVMR